EVEVQPRGTDQLPPRAGSADGPDCKNPPFPLWKDRGGGGLKAGRIFGRILEKNPKEKRRKFSSRGTRAFYEFVDPDPPGNSWDRERAFEKGRILSSRVGSGWVSFRGGTDFPAPSSGPPANGVRRLGDNSLIFVSISSAEAFIPSSSLLERPEIGGRGTIFP